MQFLETMDRQNIDAIISPADALPAGNVSTPVIQVEMLSSTWFV